MVLSGTQARRQCDGPDLPISKMGIKVAGGVASFSVMMRSSAELSVSQTKLMESEFI